MDNSQVCAVRHKRHIIAGNVQLDDDTITELTDRTLINKAMLENMKVAIVIIVVVITTTMQWRSQDLEVGA